MIHYHGGPITPDTCALKAWKGRHAFISFANPGQLALASEVTQSFALDNGAFSFWTKKTRRRLERVLRIRPKVDEPSAFFIRSDPRRYRRNERGKRCTD